MTIEDAQLSTLIDDYVAALRAKDADGVVAHHAEGLVQFLLAPPLQYEGTTVAAGRKDLQEWFSTFQGPIGYEIREQNTTAGDDVAFSHSLNRMTGTKVTGEKVDLWFRSTLCFRKFNGEWKITHAHESVPFLMDGSDKAALDLKP
jgi:ketosteroid isomerase-like protein